MYYCISVFSLWMAHQYVRHVSKIDTIFFPVHFSVQRAQLTTSCSHSRELPTHFTWNPVTFPVTPLRYSVPHLWCKYFSHHSCGYQPLSWLTFPAAPPSVWPPLLPPIRGQSSRKFSFSALHALHISTCSLASLMPHLWTTCQWL